MAENKKVPLFRNRTKIDQLVYDESYSPIVTPPGKTIRGEWYRKYAGKNKPLVLISKEVEEVEEKSDEVETEDDAKQESTDGKDKK